MSDPAPLPKEERMHEGTLTEDRMNMPTRYPPQKGVWTLIAPDGRKWEADSPLAVCGKEQRERMPASLLLERIYRAMDDESPAGEPPDVPSVEPIARVINNNQPGWTNIVETAPNVTLDVGAPLYSRESVMRLAAALAGAIDRAAQPPSPELPAPLITLNGRQVAEIYDFIDLAAGSTSGFETDVSIQWFEERPPVDGEPSPAGYYAWITDYPEEGSIYLNDQPTLTKRTGRCPHGYELANLDDGTDTCKGCSPEGEESAP